MKMVIANILVALMAVTYILLAVQAEPVTAVLGYSFGVILFLGLIRQVVAQAKEEEEDA